jgi:predicted MFS family arabinose efflux permease
VKYIGYAETGASLGLTMGPFICGLLYRFLDFAGTFVMFSIVYSLTCLYLYSTLPKRMNNTQDIGEEDNPQNGSNQISR